MSAVLAVVIRPAWCPLVAACSALEIFGGSIAGDAAGSVFTALGSWLASGAQGLVNHVLELLSSPTGSLAGAGSRKATAAQAKYLAWFTGQESLMIELMGVVVLPILLISTIGAMVRQDLGRLARTWLVALPLSLICGFVGVELTETGLKITDALSSAVLSSVNLGTTIGAAIADTASITGVAGPVAPVVVALLAILGGLTLWMELVLRSAAIYIALLFLPLAMSGLVWPTTTRMAKRLVEMLVALILSKFVVAAVLSLGAQAVGQGGEDAALTGAAMLMLAAFAPFVLLRMVPIVEASALAHLEGVSRRPVQGVTRAAQTGTGLASSVLGLARQSGGSSIAASHVAGAAIPEHRGEYSPGSGGSSGGAADPAGGSGHGGAGGGGGASGGSGGLGGGSASGVDTSQSRAQSEAGLLRHSTAGQTASAPADGAVG